MSRVYWDSMLFIYWLESNPAYFRKVDLLFKTIVAQGNELCTSIFTIGEVLVGPMRTQDHRLTASIERLFDQGQITLLPVSREATRIFANLRATTRIAAADALHLACAGAHGVDAFYTNDKDLFSLQIPGIAQILSLNAKP